MVQWYWSGIWETGIQFSALPRVFLCIVIHKLLVSGVQVGTNYGIS